jgi:hypothetical protein
MGGYPTIQNVLPRNHHRSSSRRYQSGKRGQLLHSPPLGKSISGCQRQSSQKPSSGPESLSDRQPPPTSRAAIYRSQVRSPLVGHNHARMPELESHIVSTRSNSIGWEHGGCRTNNTTSIHLLGLAPAALRTSHYDTGCSSADIAYSIGGTRRSFEHEP